jgi:hypothetical protein
MGASDWNTRRIAQDVRYPESFISELLEAHAAKDVAVPPVESKRPIEHAERPGVISFPKNRANELLAAFLAIALLRDALRLAARA